MRELVLVVPRAAVEDVLDRLLLAVPGGVRESGRGRDVELSMRGSALPSASALKRVAGRWPHRVIEREVSDDWRERRAADYSPDVIGGRLVVRPEWAAASSAASPEMIEIVLGESAAFGGGTHPTTRACLELLLALPPAGSFADLGSGSGVLAILAARQGWAPVFALDIQPASVEAVRANASRNGVEVEARMADLAAEPPPSTDAFAANIPPALHQRVAGALGDRVAKNGLLSGYGPEQAATVLAMYAAHGFRQRKRVQTHGWTVLLIERS